MKEYHNAEQPEPARDIPAGKLTAYKSGRETHTSPGGGEA